MEALLVAALAAAFVLSGFDYWRYLGVLRPLIALGSAMVCLPWEGFTTVIAAAAAAFVALFLLQVVERINARPSGRLR